MWKSEDRRQRTDDRILNTEVGMRKSEKGQMADDISSHVIGYSDPHPSLSFIFKLISLSFQRLSYMKLQMFGTVGRATVPAETGRHGGRPYDSTSQSFLFDLTGRFFGQRRRSYETIHSWNSEPQNIECCFFPTSAFRLPNSIFCLFPFFRLPHSDFRIQYSVFFPFSDFRIPTSEFN